ncbi:vesicle coat component [Mortierella antarctica]|nr:vesicle coat component [Mortierella antarctica]
MAQPPVQDGPIPFFGAAPATGPPSSNRQPPPPQRPPQHQQQHLQQQQQQQHQHHQQQQQQQQQRPPMQPQPQRHPQQHPHQMPPHPQPGSQQTLQRPQPPRQMNQSPFAPAADLFASPPTSNLIFNQAQAPPQGYQPQPGPPPPPPAQAQAQAQPVVQAPPQAQAPVQQQQQPPRFPPQQSPVLQKSLQQQQQPALVAQHQPPPPPVKQQQQHVAPPQRPPVQQQQQQQQQQHHQQAPPNQFQRNPQQQQFPSAQEQQQQQEQHQQHQQGFPQVQESAPVPAATAVPLAEQSNSPFAPAADLFGNSTLHEATGWAIPSTASQPLANALAPTAPPGNAFAPPHHQQQQQQHQQQQQPPSAQPFSAVPAPGIGRPPLAPPPLQKQPSLTQVPQAQQAQQAPLAPPPQRQPSLPSPQQQHQHQHPPVQQQQYHQAPSRQGSISTQGPPLGPPRHSPIAPGPHGPPPAQHGFDRSAGQLPPIPRTSMATPRQGPLSGPLSASSTYQGTSPYANHVPPKTPLLTAIQTPLMLPAQTLQSYQSSRTPYMGPVRNQFGSSSQLLLEPCPYAECGGENKPHAKFCSECGRSISTASRSATPSLGHYAEFPGSAAPPMPSLERMNSYHEQQPQHQQQLDQQPQPAETYTGYTQDTENYQQQQQQQPDYTQDQQQYGYSEDQQQQQQEQQQPYDQGYDQTYDQNYGQGYSDAAYYDQNQQVYDPATGQYVDTYAQEDQIVPEPEPEPEEEYIDDPLNRINGCPLIAFGFGGKIMTSFPRTVQRFDSATSNMITKKYPGDLQLEHIKDILQGDKAVSTYPGPLLMDSLVQRKNKRKDVLKMIEDKIKEFEHEPESGLDAHHVLIWRLFKVMFEQDGALVGGAKVDEAVRSVLLSIPLSVYPAQPSQEPTSPLRTSASMDVLQDLLRNGDRAGAVRYAMSSSLWAHALVISSCVNKELWKEAVNGFVNQELTSGGGDVQANGREALRVLYALFSGQTQTAITELIPLNLRTPAEVAQDDAPIGDDQFVTGASLSLMKPAEEHTEGSKVPSTSLGQWRDTLVMILSNRTSGDQTAISSLGDLLLKEGWVEAAHICYLLSPQSSVHSGPDAQLNRLVLIGADANPHGAFPFYKNVEAFQKTEIYEFACALRSAGATGGLPFLQAYKLIYVWTLVELGMFSEAGRYLASVEAIVKTQTKGSPYYNIVFLERLKDITERLTGSSQLTVADEGWFTKKVPKPTIGGIFDALDNKISKFIAGDNDQPKPVIAEPTTNAAETGPFANAPALPDLSNIPARTASRSSNGVRQGPPAANTSRRSSGLGRASLDVPKIDTYSHLQAAVPHTDAVQEAIPTFDGTAAQDPAYDNYAGYDQNAQYGAETYPQGDYSNTGYEPENQAYTYDSTQTYGETYQAEDGSAYPQDQAQDQLQPDVAGQEYQQQSYGGEENLQTQSGYEGQYDAQYNAQYDASQYEQPAHEATAGETVAALAIQPDVVPASADSAQFSTMAVLGSEKPSVDSHPDVTAADASAESAAPAGEYDANYGQYPEGAEGTFDNTAYAGEYQQDGYQQGEYQQDAYQQGEYQQDAYQQGEYQQDAYQQGEYQQDGYQQAEYQQGDYQQGDYQQGEYQQGEYQQDAYQQGEDQVEQYQQDNAVYAEQQYSEQQQYDQSIYQDQSQAPAVEGADQGLGAEYSDLAYQSQGIEEPQQVLEASAAQANPVSEIAPQAAEQVQEVLADEPTFEQQSSAEDTAPLEPAVEATAHATNIEQDGYQQDGYQQGEYQQDEYQQGDYQQGDYSQADYQQGEYAQDGYQQGDYQQGEYQQADYQQGEYAQDGYQQADYQQGDYQQADYQQGEYQQGEYAQDGYQQGDYQQGDYQQAEYAQEGYQQEEQHTGTEAEQTSTEPGVLPVTSEYQDQAEFNASGVYQGHPNGAEYSTEGEQPQQDYASNNNAWWGNGEGAYSDPNATEQQPLPVEGQAPVEDGSQANYEEGQFISFGAVPTIPSFGQPAVPVNNTSQHQHAFDDGDDLGMGNNALKKEKPAVAAEDGNSANAAGESSQDANAAMGDGSDDSKAGWWPKIALFGGEKRELTPKPVKANLGEESSFYFDKEQKRWVNKKGGSESSSTSEALPPPPKSGTPAAPAAAGSGPSPVAGGPPVMNRGPPSSGGPVPPAGGPPGPRPGAGSTARRGARAKYVDVLNPQ